MSAVEKFLDGLEQLEPGQLQEVKVTDLLDDQGEHEGVPVSVFQEAWAGKKRTFLFRPKHIEEDTLLVLRRLTPPEFDAAMAVLSNLDATEKHGSAYRTMAARCILFPSRKEFSALLEEYPGLALQVGSTLLSLAGLAKGGEAKKR